MIAVIKREKKIEFTSISLTLRSKELHGFTPDESLALLISWIGIPIIWYFRVNFKIQFGLHIKKKWNYI